MKIPSRIRVLTQEYKIKFVKDLNDDHGADGMLKPREHLILIDESLKDNQATMLRTLWHEVGHAYALESGLHEYTSAQALEQFCQTFSAVVIDLTGGKIKGAR